MEQTGCLDVAMVETGSVDGINYLGSNLNMRVRHRHRNLHEEKVIVRNTPTASHGSFHYHKSCFQVDGY